MARILVINVLVLVLVSISASKLNYLPSTHVYELFRTIYQCPAQDQPFHPSTVRIIYDVNPSEGFNLRRDVYLRMAVFVKKIRRFPGWSDTKLVLPPFRNLYHWHSHPHRDVSYFWNKFFDLASMAGYTEVLDLWQIFDEPKPVQGVAHVVRLRNFEDMFENGRFIEKYRLAKEPSISIRFSTVMGYANLTQSEQPWGCRFQGSVMQLQPVLERLWRAVGAPKHFTVFLRNAEVVLHDGFGDLEFWRARRSMRFSDPLFDVAKRFRATVMKDDGDLDGVQRPTRWQDEKNYRKAKGGNYLCAHLRRGDFLQGRTRTTPTLKSAALQIRNELSSNDVNTVFVSSDCLGTEFNDLKRWLPHARVVRFKPDTQSDYDHLGDGAIAIVDQIICSYARYFVGTYDSTFTYRIYEEREILGFTVESTFNTFCVNFGSADEDCEQNSVWPIVYE